MARRNSEMLPAQAFAASSCVPRSNALPASTGILNSRTETVRGSFIGTDATRFACAEQIGAQKPIAIKQNGTSRNKFIRTSLTGGVTSALKRARTSDVPILIESHVRKTLNL